MLFGGRLFNDGKDLKQIPDYAGRLGYPARMELFLYLTQVKQAFLPYVGFDHLDNYLKETSFLQRLTHFINHAKHLLRILHRLFLTLLVTILIRRICRTESLNLLCASLYPTLANLIFTLRTATSLS
jgi:hypothetical protein